MSEFQLVQAPKINAAPQDRRARELDELAAKLRGETQAMRDEYAAKMREHRPNEGRGKKG